MTKLLIGPNITYYRCKRKKTITGQFKIKLQQKDNQLCKKKGGLIEIH